MLVESHLTTTFLLCPDWIWLFLGAATLGRRHVQRPAVFCLSVNIRDPLPLAAFIRPLLRPHALTDQSDCGLSLNQLAFPPTCG